MNRRTLFRKAALLTVAAPVAFLSFALPTEVEAKKLSIFDGLQVNGTPLLEGVAPYPVAKLSYAKQFPQTSFVPYVISTHVPALPSIDDPLGQRGSIAVKYIWQGEMYGTWIQLDERVFAHYGAVELDKIAMDLLEYHMKAVGVLNPVIMRYENFSSY